ncbi:hypothetical protein BHE74_00036572 [Ensete ventricosum]|uniref:Uncharacterized protein n=1 Tax=Ensete ventricosum TaxID=4639 RepID=A0A444D9I3_ENSVE|nr:hypothetical protein GW17_00042677 [Ensete ventricosum]RWW56683.1 hypothetical protein BHE74_00036572 [Ensete ventricosum]RZR74509.1 hypothetical protein BHM03_00037688 [Ensete ventricosum]
MTQRVPVIGLALALVTMLLLGLASAQSGCTTVIISLSPLPQLHHRQHVHALLHLLLPARQRRPVAAGVPLLGAQRRRLLARGHHQPVAALPEACKVQTPPVSECSRKHSINIHRQMWTGKITDDSGNTVNARQSRAGGPIHTSNSKNRFYCYYDVGFSRVKSRADEVIYMITSSVHSSNVDQMLQ